MFLLGVVVLLRSATFNLVLAQESLDEAIASKPRLVSRMAGLLGCYAVHCLEDELFARLEI